jgi:hypothetical protein
LSHPRVRIKEGNSVKGHRKKTCHDEEEGVGGCEDLESVCNVARAKNVTEKQPKSKVLETTKLNVLCDRSRSRKQRQESTTEGRNEGHGPATRTAA